MPIDLQASMPILTLVYQYQIAWEAIDPATAAPVAGVVIQNATVYGQNLSGGAGLTAGPYMLVAGPQA